MTYWSYRMLRNNNNYVINWYPLDLGVYEETENAAMLYFLQFLKWLYIMNLFTELHQTAYYVRTSHKWNRWNIDYTVNYLLSSITCEK